jgi:TRAP-type transport system periplasmic protein
MFNNRTLTRTCLAALMTAGLTGATFQQVVAQETIQWDMPVYLGLNAPTSQLLQGFADEVKEKTDGRLEITVRPPGELPYSAGEYHRVVGAGDIAMADTAWFTADVPAAGVLTSAGLVQNFDELRKAMPAVEDKISEQLDRFGAEVLFWWAFAPIKFYGAGDPPEGINDLAGLRVRALSPEHSALLEAVDATPVAIAAPEVMTALQYGTVNAAMTTAIGIVSASWDESLDWAYTLEIAPTPSYVIVNSDMLAELPDDVRQALLDVAADYGEKMLDFVEQKEAEDEAALAEAGMTIVEPTEEDRERLYEIVQPLWENWVEQHGEGAAEIMQSVRDAVGR